MQCGNQPQCRGWVKKKHDLKVTLTLYSRLSWLTDPDTGTPALHITLVSVKVKNSLIHSRLCVVSKPFLFTLELIHFEIAMVSAITSPNWRIAAG
jgi:hypothetical protein